MRRLVLTVEALDAIRIPSAGVAQLGPVLLLALRQSQVTGN